MSRSILLLLFLLISGSSLNAQYYDSRSYEPSKARYLSAGFLYSEFQRRSSNQVADSLAIEFKRVMPLVAFRQGLFEIAFGYTRYTLQGESRSAIFFGGTYSNEFVLTGNRTSAFLFPFLLSTDFTKAEGNGVERQNFNIASIGIGGGLKYRYFGEAVDFSLRTVEVVHFSFEGLGVGSGFSAATIGEVLFLFKDAFVMDGIALGYRFRLQTWAMDNADFNYRSISHGPFVGVIF
jgi:hypothetical protein